MPNADGDTTYTIYWEKKFLDDLGTGRWSKCRSSRATLLHKYIESIVLRSKPWVRQAFDYANLLLKMEER